MSRVSCGLGFKGFRVWGFGFWGLESQVDRFYKGPWTSKRSSQDLCRFVYGRPSLRKLLTFGGPRGMELQGRRFGLKEFGNQVPLIYLLPIKKASIGRIYGAELPRIPYQPPWHQAYTWAGLHFGSWGGGGGFVLGKCIASCCTPPEGHRVWGLGFRV